MDNKQSFKKATTPFLFLLVFTGFLLWLIPQGTMIDASGDAADVWKTITTFHTDNIYPSYVLYKGAMSVYPYVWLYRLAVLFNTSDFLFVMIYHALLFSYVSVIGIPNIISNLLHYNAKLWQRIALIAFLFLTWKPTFVLDQMMVDLPSCVFFICAINCCFKLVNETTNKKYLWAALAGLLTGLCANISGQYSLSEVCLLIFIIIKLLPIQTIKNKKLVGKALVILLLFVTTMSLPKLANGIFERAILAPMEANGVYISSSEAWMERGLIYMQDKGRYFIGAVSTPRGTAILEDYYGASTAQELFALAKDGGYGWTIPEYFKIMLHYPLETLTQYFDRGFLSLSIDQGNNSAPFLIIGYTLLYLAILTAVKRIRRVKDFFCAELLIVLAAFAAIIPLAVMTVEMRCCISFQGFVLGIGLAGPAIPEAASNIKNGYLKLKNREVKLRDMSFPWAFVIWLVFIAVCLTHISTLYSTGGSASMLFNYTF